MLEMTTQVSFTVLGVALLVHLVGHTEIADLVTKGLLLAAFVIAGAFAALWLGLAAVIEKAALRLGRSGWLSPILVGAAVGATVMMLITGVRLLRARQADARAA